MDSLSGCLRFCVAHIVPYPCFRLIAIAQFRAVLLSDLEWGRPHGLGPETGTILALVQIFLSIEFNS